MRYFNLAKQKTASLLDIAVLQQEFGNAYEVIFRIDDEVVGAPIAFHHDANASLTMKTGKIKVVAVSLSINAHKIVFFFHNLLFLTDSI